MAIDDRQPEKVVSQPIGMRLKPWLVWILGCLFYFYEFFVQVSPSVMAHSLMHDLFITASTLGILVSVYFYAYAAMQIPVGLLIDRFGAHRLLTVAAAVCGLANSVFAMTSNLYIIAITRFMLGVGSSFSIVGVMKLINNWFPARQFALLVGATVTIGMLGAIGGEAPLALLIGHIGWRHSMLLLGVIGLLIALLIHLFSQDYPKAYEQKIQTQALSFRKRLHYVLSIKQLWIATSYGGLMYLSTPVLCGLWGVPYLHLKYAISIAESATIISLVFLGWVVCSAFWGWFSDYIKKRLPVLTVAVVGALITLSIVVYFRQPIWLLSLLLFLFGGFSCAFLPIYSIAREIVAPEYCATALSFTNMMNMIGIAIVQPLVGWVIEKTSTVTTQGNIHYSIVPYNYGLSMLVLSLVIALILLPFIRETYCRPCYRQ